MLGGKTEHSKSIAGYTMSGQDHMRIISLGHEEMADTNISKKAPV